MKYVKTLLILVFFFSLQNSEAQISKSHIAKLGFSSDIMPFQESGNYSINFDLENSTLNNFITNEIGAGYMHSESDMFYLKFDYKFYPISAILNNFKYQGLYVSLGPGIYYEEYSKNENSYGLGIFTTAGVQFLINNRLSLAFEIEMDFVSNINSEYGNDNKHFSNSLKVGYVFNRKPKNHNLPRQTF